MKRVVLDASIALTWCFDDEGGEYSEAVLDALSTSEPFAPGLWPLEVANTLVLAIRRKRLAAKAAEQRFAFFRALPIQLEHAPSELVFGSIRALAVEHDLTIYDAAYLELALRLDCSLATVDSRLRAAAVKHGRFLASP